MKQSLWGLPATTLVAALLAVVFARPADAEESKGFQFDLSLNVIGADLGDLGAGAPFSFNVGGLPVSVAAESGDDTGNPGLRAGLSGDYFLPLGSGFSLVTTGNIEKTRYLEDTLFGRDRLTGATSLRFEDGSFKTALEPGIDVDLLAGSVDTQHLLLNGRLSRDIYDGLAVKLAAGWAIQEHPSAPRDDAELGHGRLAFDFSIGDRAKLALAYDISRSWARLPEDDIASAGPAVGLDLAVLAGLDIGFNYQYCENTSYDGELRALVAVTHALGLTATWQDPDHDYLTFSGGYTLDRAASAGVAETSHDGMVNMALKF